MPTPDMHEFPGAEYTKNCQSVMYLVITYKSFGTYTEFLEPGARLVPDSIATDDAAIYLRTHFQKGL